MTTKDEALKLALEALEMWCPMTATYLNTRDKAITAIREALAEQCVCGEPDTPGTHRTDGPCLAEQPAQQQEQQPPYEFERYVAGSLRAQGVRVERATTLADAMRIAARICPPANPPSAPTVLVYTSPPIEATPLASQRSVKPWVGLTQQDIDIAFDDTQEGGGFDEFARAIEAKLKEKNNV